MSTRGYIGYRYKGEIFGWFNHFDSYPSGLGTGILNASLPCTQEQVRHFFLTHVKFVEREEAQKKTTKLSESADLCEIDWRVPTKIRIKQLTHVRDRDFYKDAIFCEYAYIFDLDAKEKTLLLFTGFGETPSEGYEDWFTTSAGPAKEKIYMQDCGAITDSLVKSLESILPDQTVPHAYGAMEFLMENRDPKVRNILLTLLDPTTDPNLYIGLINKLSGDEDISGQAFLQAILESRLKNPTT